ncbi:unnamed protein product, partial [Mesorhabditis spiculigera]
MSSPVEEEPPEQPSTSFQPQDIESSQQPKKGILKRPATKADNPEKKESNIPVWSGYRKSPDRFPNKAETRIPKLSVTCDENGTDSDQNMMNDLGNGRGKDKLRQTAILDSDDGDEGPPPEPTSSEKKEEIIEEEDEDTEEDQNQRLETMSVASSTASGGSSIVGRWWVAKDTRYVPHCVKRGCKHSGHDHPEEYLTPTQRKAKEISDLKKELQNVSSERDEKERHLQELRSRMDEIESLRDSNAVLTESRTSAQSQEIGQFEKERKAIERRHAVRVNQLVHETMQAREENAKLAVRIKGLEDRYVKTSRDEGTMTDVSSVESPYTHIAIMPDASGTNLHTVLSLPDMNNPKIAISNPNSPMNSADGSRQPMYMSPEAVTAMQAYKNEAFIWRNKAAQLEIIIRDQLIRSPISETAAGQEIEKLRRECQRLRDLLNEREGGMIDSGIDAPPSPQREGQAMHSQNVSGECTLANCIERKKNLIDENNALIETNEEMTLRISELEEDIAALRKELETFEEDCLKKDQKVEQFQKEADSKSAETAAATLVITRLQTEAKTMQKAISYMEERMTAYQNVILDHGLVVQDEETHNWRRGFSNPKYITANSKKAQTTLTSDALNKHMDEFDSVQQKLKSLHEEFSAKRTDLSDRFSEIEANLLTKTKLVETLTKQLEDVRKDQRLALDQHQVERNNYKKSLKEIGKIAERVPGLETQIEQLEKEKSEFDFKFKEAQENYEKGLEDALSESLRKYQEQSHYWKDKCVYYDNTITKLRNEIEAMNKDKEELRLKAKMNKADLEHRLASSIEHASQMHHKMSKPKRDVEVEAKPRQSNKYVACRPYAKEKGTHIEKGELFDEREERLKLCQGELSTTRRQVQTLQQKLLNYMKEKNEKSRTRAKIPGVLSKESEINDENKEQRQTNGSEAAKKDDGTSNDCSQISHKDDEIFKLNREKDRLHEKIGEVEEEKNRLVKEERARIQQLVAEFDNVRNELDQEICRYESERKWLKSRIENLEKANTELEKLNEKYATPSPVAAVKAPTKEEKMKAMREEKIRRTFSDTDLISDLEECEVAQLKEKVASLNREMLKVHGTIVKTAMAAKEATKNTGADQGRIGSAFNTLVEDINMVKGDLEKVLVRITPETATTIPEEPKQQILKTASTNDAANSGLLEKVIYEWDAENSTSLAKDLARSRSERQFLKLQNERLHLELARSNNELEILRKEPLNSTPADPETAKMKRSKSNVELAEASAEKKECKQWQNKAGTLFREVHRMRQDYTDALKDRRELKIQLAMIRGELELTRIQLAEQQRRSPTSLLSHSFIMNRDGREMIKEMSVPVHLGNSDFKLTGKHTPTGSQILVEASEPEPSVAPVKADRESRSSVVERVSFKIRMPSSNERATEETKKTRQRRSESAHATLAKKLPQLIATQKSNATLMSQSWHAERENGSLSEQEDVQPPVRTVHLREKVKILVRENKVLQEKLENMEKETKKTPLPVQIVVPNRSSQIDILEQENKRLKRELKKARDSATPGSMSNRSSASIDVDTSRMSEDSSQLRTEIEKLENLVKGEQSQPSKMTIAQQSEKSKTEQKTDSEFSDSRLSQERDDLKRKVEQLEMELKMSASTSSMDTSKIIDRASKTDEEIEKMVEEATHSSKKEARLLRDRVEGLERHMHTEKEQLQNEHAKRVETLERGRRNVLQENTLMMQKLESMGQEIEQNKELRKSLEVENKALQDKAKILEDRNSILDAENKKLAHALRENAAKIEQLISESNILRSDLELAKQSATQATDELEKHLAEKSTSTEENTWLTKENESLRENIEELKKQLEEDLTNDTDSKTENHSSICISYFKNGSYESIQKESVKQGSSTASDDLKLKMELTKRENELYAKKIKEMEQERADMYAVMFRKGQQAVAFAAQEDRVVDQLTEDRITLRFLHDAFYYYLLNRGEEKDHLTVFLK